MGINSGFKGLNCTQQTFIYGVSWITSYTEFGFVTFLRRKVTSDKLPRNTSSHPSLKLLSPQ